MNITVYLGALEGKDPALKRAVRELGTWIGESGNALVYGGSRSGLMGEIAESVLQAGGKVTGVEPQFFIEAELQHEGLTSLIITKDMSERKAKMIELGDAFIAFPGGTGLATEWLRAPLMGITAALDAELPADDPAPLQERFARVAARTTRSASAALVANGLSTTTANPATATGRADRA